MFFLRVIYVAGMAVHKLVWEVLKRRDSRPEPAAEPVSPTKRLVKLFKAMVLGAIILQTLFVPDFPQISKRPFWLRVVGTVIYFVGLATAILGRLQLGDNWVDLEDYQVIPEQALVTKGLYRFIRHPIYAGDILLLLGLELALNSWLVLGTVPLTAVVLRQAKAEEEVLSDSFTNYEEYRQQSKMLIPFIL